MYLFLVLIDAINNLSQFNKKCLSMFSQTDIHFLISLKRNNSIDFAEFKTLLE